MSLHTSVLAKLCCCHIVCSRSPFLIKKALKHIVGYLLNTRHQTHRVGNEPETVSGLTAGCLKTLLLQTYHLSLCEAGCPPPPRRQIYAYYKAACIWDKYTSRLIHVCSVFVRASFDLKSNMVAVDTMEEFQKELDKGKVSNTSHALSKCFIV